MGQMKFCRGSMAWLQLVTVFLAGSCTAVWKGEGQQLQSADDEHLQQSQGLKLGVGNSHRVIYENINLGYCYFGKCASTQLLGLFQRWNQHNTTWMPEGPASNRGNEIVGK